MKKIIAVLTLVFVCEIASQAVALEYFGAGAWWDTKVSVFRKRGAGEMRLWLYTDKTVLAEYYFNGVLIQSGAGTWADTKNLFVKNVTVLAPGGQFFRGPVNKFSGFGSGVFRGGGDVGRWQVVDPN